MWRPELDPFQFACRSNLSTYDAISTALHFALTHVGVQHLDVQLAARLPDGETTGSTDWQQHIQHHHPEHRGSPRRLSSLIFTLLTYDYTRKHNSNFFIKFVDNSTVVGLISNTDETDVLHWREWQCQVPGSACHQGPLLGQQHLITGQESSPVSLLPLQAETSQSPDPHHVFTLQRRNHIEHPDQLHHCV